MGKTKPGQLTDYAVALLKSYTAGWLPLSDRAEQRLADRFIAAVKIETAILFIHRHERLIHDLRLRDQITSLGEPKVFSQYAYQPFYWFSFFSSPVLPVESEPLDKPLPAHGHRSPSALP